DMAIPPGESVLGHGVTIVYRRGSSRKAEKAYGEKSRANASPGKTADKTCQNKPVPFWEV
ncbi:MAG: hypothetical protein SOX28_05990, partial [Collinsella sp.]|nr:hypothetical protein [Collinsella sp.]